MARKYLKRGRIFLETGTRKYLKSDMLILESISTGITGTASTTLAALTGVASGSVTTPGGMPAYTRYMLLTRGL